MADDMAIVPFSFLALRKLRVFDPSEFANANNGTSNFRLLTVSNKHGLLFAVSDKRKLVVIETSEVERVDDPKERAKETTEFKKSCIELFAQESNAGNEFKISNIQCNCDGALLAICVEQPLQLACIYDVRVFYPGFPGRPAPFCKIPLSNNVGTLLDFQWNPTISAMFAACTAGGTISTISVDSTKQNSFLIHGMFRTTAPEPSATCISWSPKGKQLAAGFTDGSLYQFKPENLQPVKKWSTQSPKAINLQDICWLSTHQFALICKPNAETVLIHVNLPKDANGQLTYVEYGEICYNSRGPTVVRYFLQHLQEWAALLCTSTASIETNVMGWAADVKRWKIWELDGEARAELPLTADNDETYPVGATVARTSLEPIVLKTPDGEVRATLPPGPLLIMLSTNGLICPFRMINETTTVEMCKAPEPVRDWSSVKCGPTAVASEASQQSKSIIIPLHPVRAPQMGSLFPPGMNPMSTSQNSLTTALPAAPVIAPSAAPVVAQTAAPVVAQTAAPVIAQTAAPLSAQTQASLFATVSTSTPVSTSPSAPAVAPQVMNASAEAIELANERRRQKVEEAKRLKEERERLDRLRMDIDKWVHEFETALMDMNSKAHNPSPLPDTRDELAAEIQKVQNIELEIEALKRDIKELCEMSQQLNTSVCGALINSDSVKIMIDRRQSEEFHMLSRHRPLTASQKRILKDLQETLRITMETINDLSSKVGQLELQNRQLGSRIWSPNKHRDNQISIEIIYSTLTNMQEIIEQQHRRLGHCKRLLAKLSIKDRKQLRLPTNEISADVEKLSESFTLSQLRDEENNVSTVSSANQSIYDVSDADLISVLQNRRHIPKRKTAPVLKSPVFAYSLPSPASKTSGAPAVSTAVQQQHIANSATSSGLVNQSNVQISSSTASKPGFAAPTFGQTIGQASSTAIIPTVAQTISPMSLKPTPSFAASPFASTSGQSTGITNVASTSQVTPSIFGKSKFPVATETSTPKLPSAKTVVSTSITNSTVPSVPSITSSTPPSAGGISALGSMLSSSTQKLPASNGVFGAARTDTVAEAEPVVSAPKAFTETNPLTHASQTISALSTATPAGEQRKISMFPPIATTSANAPSFGGTSIFQQLSTTDKSVTLGSNMPSTVVITPSTGVSASASAVTAADAAPLPSSGVSSRPSNQPSETPKTLASGPSFGDTVFSLQPVIIDGSSLTGPSIFAQLTATTTTKTETTPVTTNMQTTVTVTTPAMVKTTVVTSPTLSKITSAAPSSVSSSATMPQLAPAVPANSATVAPTNVTVASTNVTVAPTTVPVVPTTSTIASVATLANDIDNAIGDMEAEMIASQPANATQQTASSSSVGFSFASPSNDQKGSAALGGGSIFGGTFGGKMSAPVAVALTPQQSSTGAFGGTGLFSGLGAKPPPDAANKNVFASPAGFTFSNVASSNSPGSGLFGGSAAQNPTTAVQTVGGFSSDASIARQGFGSFATPPSSPGFGQLAGFGGVATFGGSGVFGGSPTFGGNATLGGASTFGGGSTFGGSPTFGGTPTQFGSGFGSGGGLGGSPFNSNKFSGFGNSMVSFGALAAGTGTPATGSPFNTATNQAGGFGSFGSLGKSATPAAEPVKQASFSQWR